jgi:6-phosphogluconolactonase
MSEAGGYRKLRYTPMKPFFILAAVLLPCGDALAASYLYLSVAGEQKIAIYAIDPVQGTLIHRTDIVTNGEPGALTFDPGRRHLFAAIRSTGELASFRIDHTSGVVTHVNTVPAGDDPAHISTDQAGRLLLTAYYRAAKVTVHTIAADGSLSEEPLQTVETADKAHAVLADPTNRFVFVPHTGPNTIFQFTFQAKTGRLAANAVPKVTTPEGTGPRHLVFHPTKQIVYVVNEQGGSVTGYALDPKASTLAPFQTASTLPVGFNGTNATAEIKIHPTAKFLYASNRGHDSIACFILDDEGKLTVAGQVPTEKTPRSFDIDPRGEFLYSAGESSGKVAAYRIDEKNGRSEWLRSYTVGKQPWWVMAVDLPGTDSGKK